LQLGHIMACSREWAESMNPKAVKIPAGYEWMVAITVFKKNFLKSHPFFH